MKTTSKFQHNIGKITRLNVPLCCRYKADPEGLFRLETVRYESLEVTQEMIQEPQSQQTLIFLEGEATSSSSSPLFIAYETLDQEGNLTSQLVGGQAVSVQPTMPVVFLEKHPEYASPPS